MATWTEAGAGPLSTPTAARASTRPTGDEGRVEVAVDAGAVTGPLDPVWRRTTGSERLSLLRDGEPGPGGSDVAAELAEALRIARDQLGCAMVRAHGTFLPELVAWREDGPPDFRGLDETYDALLATGLEPVVELSFMPAPLASDPSATVHAYQGVISPPRDWAAWGRLCGDLAAHLGAVRHR